MFPSIQSMLLNYKTTFGGVIAILTGLGALGAALQKTINGHFDYQDYLPGLAGIGVGWGMLHAKDANVTGAGLAAMRVTAPVQTPTPVTNPPPAPKGLGHLAVVLFLIALTTVLLIGANLARADDPKFGGCLKNGTTCFAPAVSLALVAIDIKSGAVESRVDPHLGYAVTFWSDKWYRAGLGGYAGFNSTSTGRWIVPSVVASFAEYLRFGFERQIGGGGRTFGLLGIGSDFGTTPAVK